MPRSPLGATAPTLVDLAVVSAALAVLAVAVFGPHVVTGGWVMDDWALVARLDAAHRVDGLQGAFSAAMDIIYRPGYGFTLFAEWLIGRDGQAPYLAIGVSLIATHGGLLYATLRYMGLAPLAALVPSILFVTVPSIDGARLWFASYNALWSTTFFLAGSLLAFRGLRASGRSAVLLHIGAVLLYFAAGVTYEIALPLVLLAPVAYALVHGLRAAAIRAPADWLAAGAALAVIVPGAEETRGGDFSIGHIADRLSETRREWLAVLEQSIPAHGLLLGPVGWVLAVLAVAGLVLAWREPEQRRAVRAWSLLTVCGLAWTWAGLAALLPATSYYIPRWQGISSRFAALSWLGEAVLLTGVLWLLAIGLATLLRRPAFSSAVAVLAALATAGTWASQEHTNQKAWSTAWREAQNVMSSVKSALPEIPRGSAVVTFRHPVIADTGGVVGALDPWPPGGVPIFQSTWDLDGAVRLLYRDESLRALPFLPGSACGAGGWRLPADVGVPAFQQDPVWRYRPGLFFVDVAGRRASRIDSRAACRTAVSTLEPRALGASA
jgi:hypothetical protein